jgi:hypothetical protein
MKVRPATEPAKRLKYNWVASIGVLHGPCLHVMIKHFEALIGVGHGLCLHVMIKHFEYATNGFCLCED